MSRNKQTIYNKIHNLKSMSERLREGNATEINKEYKDREKKEEINAQ